jgi:hypothetical protein
MTIFAGYGGPSSPSFVPDELTTLRKASTSNPIAVTTSETPKEVAVGHLATAFRLEVGCANYSGYVAGTNFWKVALEASVDPVSTNFKQIGECVLMPKKVTDFSIRSEILTNGIIAQSLAPGAKYLRVTAVKVGTPGPISYNAHMSPIGPLGG